MKLLFFVLFQFIVLNSIYSQESNTVINKNDTNYFLKLEVKINNFNLIPSVCGVMKWVSVYKATIISPNFIFNSKEILILVTCREAYGFVISKDLIYYIDCSIKDQNIENASIINFSGVDNKLMKGMKMATLYKIKSASNL